MVYRGAVLSRRCFLAAAAVIVALASAGSSASGSSLGASSTAAIAAGYYHTCAILDGAAKCWGDNVFGQLGDGTDALERSRPVAVSGLESGVRAIATGTFHSCALAGDGAVKCWGDDEDGQLGDGTKTSRSTPVVVSGLESGVQAIATGDEHTCALLSSGRVECWGANFYGELGNGTRTESSTPVAVSGLSSGVQAITAGDGHTCALLSSGGVECWGGNRYGQLGDGTKTSRSTPVAVSGLASGVQAIAAGANHTCALLNEGVECWGENDDGELGDGTKTHRSRPVAVSGLPAGVQAIGAGADAFHTCALLSGGSAKCWGDNDHGQLGDGTTTNRSAPVAVSGLESGVQAIVAGDFHTCALLSAGGFKCLGRNNAGQLGNGTFDRVLKVEVRGRGTVTAPGFRCSKDCELDRLQGTRVVLTARAATGWRFKFWVYERYIGACKGRHPRCSVVLDANYYATARFARRR
jgi:alpha-tubulin suppressor-like RCC1 family protein